MIDRQQVLYNMLFEEGAEYYHRSADARALAVKFSGKPLWIYAKEGLSEDNLRSFFFSCLKKDDLLSGFVAAPWVADICKGLHKPLTAYWEMSAYYIDKNINPSHEITWPGYGDFMLIGKWIKAFFTEALDIELNNAEEMGKALIKSRHLYILDIKGIGPVAMGMLIPLPNGMERLNLIYTPEMYRGKGYGKQLTSGLVNKSQLKGKLPVLYAKSANLRAVNMYKSLGFKKAGELVEVRY